MAYSNTTSFAARLISGFIAGFCATLIFHQLTLWALWGAGLAPFAPFSMAATKPLGVPAVISLAFWGGLWGIVFKLVEGKFPQNNGYWTAAFLFGALLPSAVALLVVLPLKGRPMGGGRHLPLLVTAILINGAWGVGAGLISRMLSGRFGGPLSSRR
ncbi:MAG: hypothetical protein AB9866_18390 [Syntrophobacteraceae bacterium]